MGRPATITLVSFVALLVTAFAAAAAGVGGARQRAAQQPETERRVTRFPEQDRLTSVTRLPAAEPAVEPRRKAPAKPREYGIVRVLARRGVKLRTSPGGSVAARVGSRSEFGSQSVLSVTERKRGWLGVVSTALPNNRVGWVRASDPAIDRSAVRVAISIDLSRRQLQLRRGKRVLARVTVAVGRPGSHTPEGRFAITDKLSGSRYGSYYGCCILALSGHQPNLPAGWTGGNRLAIHGTNAPGSLGKASSAGCLRAADADLRVLMRRVPLGTPVFVHG